jgi:hypothetical protein
MVSPLVVSSAAFIGPYPQHGHASNAFPGRGGLRALYTPYEAVPIWTLAGSRRSSSLNSWRATARFKHRRMSRTLLPSDRRRAAYARVSASSRSLASTMVDPRQGGKCVSSSDLAPLVVMNIGSSVPAELKAWGDNPAAWTG